MPRIAHRIFALLATATIALFFGATVLVELFGSAQAVAELKRLIVFPGLWVLVPAVAATGGSGFAAGRSRSGRLLAAKQRRMPWIALNGLLVLVPCAILLQRWSAAGRFDTAFYLVQAIELLAGATNLVLMGLNIRDGLHMSGRLRPGRHPQNGEPDARRHP
jgi:hypothetical protein